MEAVKAGVGREAAHQAIKEHAVATVKDLRTGKISANDLVDRLALDERLGLERDAIQRITENAAALLGNAQTQVEEFGKIVGAFVKNFPNAANYEPTPLL